MADTDQLEPDIISEGGESFLPGLQEDPAYYLVDPGDVTGPGKYSAGQLAHARPSIYNGKDLYVFPVGPEAFREEGQATLGLHQYIGDIETDGVTVHYDESRITLSGTFPGLTSQNNMVACRNILRSVPGKRGVILYVPGVFEQEQYVLPESWTFNHDADDRTHSIDYTITFVRIGTHGRIADPSGTIPPPNPGGNSTGSGKPHKIFVVKANVRTLRAIAKKVYHDADQWSRIVKLNEGLANRWIRHHRDVPMYKMATYRWPLGTKFRY